MTSLTIKFKTFPVIAILLLQLSTMSSAGTILPSANANRNLFAADLYQKIVADKSEENVIFSPASIQTCAALAYFGADGKTAEEMQVGLKLGHGEREDLAKNFGEFIRTSFKTSNNENDAQLRMANRIYTNKDVDIKPEFNEIATKYFESQAEKLDFADSANAVKKINTWVEAQTNDKIKDLLQPGNVNGDTTAILVNAIYFKAKWVIPFSSDMTHKAEFAVNGKDKTSVDMMHMDERVRYADLPELDATVLELPYQNTELTMLFLLPKKTDGLKNLEQKLTGKDLNEIASVLNRESVNIFIPKFRIEFDVDLKKPLAELGLSAMFTDDADFSRLFETKNKISEVKHKAYIDVNEAGSEAAAATFMKIVPMSLNLDQKTFRADHPFVFAIRSPSAVYFAGHVTKF